jgi:hypothetical protein
MTFILTEINHDGIIMAADSAETRTISGKEYVVEVDKTLYFPKINIGISTWGEAMIKNQGINEWFQETVNDFSPNSDIEGLLPNISTYLAQKT